MHRIKSIFFVVLLGVIAGVAYWSLSWQHHGAPVVSGTIETDEVQVASRYGGRVIQIGAKEGDTLGAGQSIVTLAADELAARRDQTAAVLLELEHGPRTNEIVAARHAWASLQADLTQAQLDARRANDLFTQKAVAEEDRDRAATRVLVLEQNSRVAEAQYRLLLEGTRPERIAQVRAQLAEIETQLREMIVVAPGDCVLEVLNVKVGDVLPANRPVATLLLPQHLWVRVYVPETWLGFIQTGQTVKARTDSTGNREFTGMVEQVNRQAEFTPRNVQTVADRVKQVFGVKVRLPTDTALLRAGMSMDVSFPNVPPSPQ